MRRPLSSNRENNVVVLLQKGWSTRKVAKCTHISQSTVQRIRKRRLPNLDMSIGGRPPLMSDSMQRACVRAVTVGGLDTAAAATRVVRQQFASEISVQTVRRTLNFAGLVARVKKSKPLLSQKNIKARLEFATSHLHWTIDDWKRVIFSDETKINCFCSDGQYWCWVEKGEGLTERIVRKIVKHGGGSLMIWGCLTAFGPGLFCKIEGIMNQYVYREILETHLNRTLTKFHLNPTRIIFQHDNDPKHTSKSVKEWLSRQPFGLLKWPPQSPDLNPIEHLWAMMKRKLNCYPSAPKGLLDLWTRVIETYESFTTEECSKLYETMPRRMRAVVHGRGKWTRF